MGLRSGHRKRAPGTYQPKRRRTQRGADPLAVASDSSSSDEEQDQRGSASPENSRLPHSHEASGTVTPGDAEELVPEAGGQDAEQGGHDATNAPRNGADSPSAESEGGDEPGPTADEQGSEEADAVSNFGQCRCFDEALPACWRARNGVKYYDGEGVYISSNSAAPHLIAVVEQVHVTAQPERASATCQIHDRGDHDRSFALVKLVPRAGEYQSQLEQTLKSGAVPDAAASRTHHAADPERLEGVSKHAEYMNRKLLASTAQEPFPFSLFRFARCTPAIAMLIHAHRGKCEVHHVQNVRDLDEYCRTPDHFFYADTLIDSHMIKCATVCPSRLVRHWPAASPSTTACRTLRPT